jgi:hypothetical protein
VDKSLDPEYRALMVVALDLYPEAFGAVTTTLTGFSPTDPEVERFWSDFNEPGHKLEEPKD